MQIAPTTEEAAEHVTVELHKRETASSGYWGHPGICTVTFCEGDPQATLEALRPRLLAVLNANPWIAGTFASKRLVHPKTGSDAVVRDILSLQRCAGLTRSTPYPALVKAVTRDPSLSVQSGGATQKAGTRITKLVVVEPEQPGHEFALVFSMSHVAADGHNYYRLFNMLAGSAPVEAMTAERVVAYEAREAEWTGKPDFGWLTSGGFLKGMLQGMLCGPRARWCAYYVDTAAVDAAKAQVQPSDGVGFVSTNDVLTSHFCRAARARVTLMTINMRHKLPIPVDDSHAGCYEGCLLLDEANAASPAAIRRCLKAGVPFTRRTESPPLPGLCEACPMAFITSWASFAFSIDLPGISRQLLHLPCMDMPDMMDVAVVFRPQPGKLGMLYLAKRVSPDALKAAGSVLGEPIDSKLFPLS